MASKIWRTQEKHCLPQYKKYFDLKEFIYAEIILDYIKHHTPKLNNKEVCAVWGDIDQSQLNRDYVQHINRHIKRVLGYPLQNQINLGISEYRYGYDCVKLTPTLTEQLCNGVGVRVTCSPCQITGCTKSGNHVMDIRLTDNMPCYDLDHHMPDSDPSGCHYHDGSVVHVWVWYYKDVYYHNLYHDGITSLSTNNYIKLII